MAVYTEISDVELIEYLKQYDIGELHSLKGIAEGVENSNYLLSTDAGMHILTLYEKRVNVDDLPFFLGLMEHLAKNGLECPQPITLNSGEQLSKLAMPIVANWEKPWRRCIWQVKVLQLNVLMRLP